MTGLWSLMQALQFETAQAMVPNSDRLSDIRCFWFTCPDIHLEIVACDGILGPIDYNNLFVALKSSNRCSY